MLIFTSRGLSDHRRKQTDIYPLHFFHPVGALREMCLIHMNIHYVNTTNEIHFKIF